MWLSQKYEDCFPPIHSWRASVTRLVVTTPQRLPGDRVCPCVQEWDILAYKALSIDPDMIFHVMEDSSLVVEGTGLPTSYSNIINNVTNLFPSNFS